MEGHEWWARHLGGLRQGTCRAESPEPQLPIASNSPPGARFISLVQQVSAVPHHRPTRGRGRGRGPRADTSPRIRACRGDTPQQLLAGFLWQYPSSVREEGGAGGRGGGHQRRNGGGGGGGGDAPAPGLSQAEPAGPAELSDQSWLLNPAQALALTFSNGNARPQPRMAGGVVGSPLHATQKAGWRKGRADRADVTRHTSPAEASAV